MNRLLRLYLSEAWPVQTMSCAWQCCDESGKTLQQGHSEPRHWPEAERCEIILDAAQCLLLKIQLPKAVRSRTADVLAYALEDHLIGEVGDEHLVVGGVSADEVDTDVPATSVWAVSRARLRAVLSVLRTCGRLPERCVSEIQLAPHHAGWTVCLCGAREAGQPAMGFVRNGAEDGFSFDGAAATFDDPPLALRRALQCAQERGHFPAGLDLYDHDGPDAEMIANWQQALGVPVRRMGRYDWREQAGRDARNLLTGEFSPPRRSWQGGQAWRSVCLLAALMAVVYSVYSAGEWAWLRHQRDEIRQQLTASYLTVAPPGQPVLDPGLQMQRLHDHMRHARGQLGASDFLPLLDAVSPLIGGQGAVRALHYEADRLEFQITLRVADDVERLRQALIRRGLGVTLRETRPAPDGRLETQWIVRGMS